ncbi:hypothetical protein OXX80_012403 [Metschnikowia pulcherrima]
MSQKSSEMASQNENGTGQASPCKRPGPDDGPILKKASGSKEVPEVQTPKSVSEDTGDPEEVESAIRGYKHRQEIGRLERELIFERQQNVDLVGEYERKVYTLKKNHEAQLHALKDKISFLEKEISSKDKKEDSEKEKDYLSNRGALWTYSEEKYLDLGINGKPDLKSYPFLDSASKHVEQDTDSDENDYETSMQSSGVDTDDMTLLELSSYYGLVKVKERLNNKNPEDDGEEEEQKLLADRLCSCLQNVFIKPKPRYEASLARVRELVQTLDRAESLLATNPKNALDGFSLGELLKVKDSLDKIVHEFSRKLDHHTELKASAIDALDKMAEPKVTSSMGKFAQYVEDLEIGIDAFWRIDECISIIIASDHAFGDLRRVEKAMRECAIEKEGIA